jgi:hypothetical protein
MLKRSNDMLIGSLGMVNVSSMIKLKAFLGALRGLLNMLRCGNRVPDMCIGSQDMLIGPNAF